MKYSLVSREWIADCIEITHSGYTGVRYVPDPLFKDTQVIIVFFLLKCL